MSVETKITQLQLKAEKDLAHVQKDLDTIAYRKDARGRELVESMTKTSTANHEAFLNELEKLNAPNFVRDFQKYISQAELAFTGSGSQYTAGEGQGTPGINVFNTGELRGAWTGFKNAVNDSIGVTALTGEQAHQDLSVIGQRAFILYTFQVQANRTTRNDLMLSAVGKVQAETFRKVYMAAVALLSAPPTIFKKVGKESLEDVQIALDYFERATSQQEWEIIKEKTINVLAGKDEQVLKIVDKQPKAQTDAEYVIAKEMGKAYDKNLDKVNRSLINNFTKLKGSKVFEDEIVKQFKDIHLIF